MLKEDKKLENLKKGKKKVNEGDLASLSAGGKGGDVRRRECMMGLGK